MLSIKDIGRVSQRYRHLMRYQQVIGIVLKYGFQNILDAMNIDHYIESGLQLIPFVTVHEKIEKYSKSQRIRMVFEELGPTFIKLGQILSSRPDLVPVALLNELTRLQDHVPAFEYDKVKSIIESEFNESVDELFESMDPAPFASASIGQVHKARLAGGDEVAVKIQRPGIRKIIEADLEIMLHLASIMENNIKEAAFFRPVRIVEEFARTLENELDYSVEAASIKQMAAQFRHDATLIIPRVYSDYSSDRVLTMAFINGIKAGDLSAIDRAGLDKKLLIRRGADFVMKQVFEHGFFHADPHPGNIFFLENNIICPIDFGMTGFLDRSTRELLVDLFHSVATRDFKVSARLLCRLGEYDTQPNAARLEKDISHFVTTHLSGTLKDIKTAPMLNEFLELCARSGLRIPPDFFLMMKAFISIEGLAQKLDPDFDMIRHAIPYVRAAKFERLKPSRIVRELAGLARETYRFIQVMPGDIIEVMDQIKNKNLTVNVQLTGLDKLMHTQDQTSNRISFAIIIAALILGSAIVVNSEVPPRLFGVSVIGIGGFVTAAVMGIWLLVAIIRRGRL